MQLRSYCVCTTDTPKCVDHSRFLDVAMQQPPALRSIYGASQVKTKHAAAVSPILDPDNDESASLSASDDSDGVSSMTNPHRRTGASNNWSALANVNRVPQDDDEDAQGIVLQKKSAQYEIPRLAVHMSNTLHSNQDVDSSNSSQKYRVLGQKQQWRKSRSSQRARGVLSTITPVDDTSVSSSPSGGDELGDDDDVDLENPRFSVRESFGPSSHESEHASLAESDVSIGRGSSFSHSSAAVSSRSDEKQQQQRFVVTQQKKSKFAARIHLPGQNPLYLGRYRTEAAALAACESAFAVITTPRK